MAASFILCQTVLCILTPPVFIVNQRSLQQNHHRLQNIQQPNIKTLNSRSAVLKHNEHENEGIVNNDSDEIENATISPPWSSNFLSQLASMNSIVNFSQTSSSSSPTVVSVVPPVKVFQIISNNKKEPLRIWGEGTEYRFPPFLEYVVYRIQTLFQVDKYDDLSRPSINEPIKVPSSIKADHEIESVLADATTTTKTKTGDPTSFSALVTEPSKAIPRETTTNFYETTAIETMIESTSFAEAKSTEIESSTLKDKTLLMATHKADPIKVIQRTTTLLDHPVEIQVITKDELDVDDDDDGNDDDDSGWISA